MPPFDYDVRLKRNGDYWQAWWINPDGTRGGRSLGNRAKLSERQANAVCRSIGVELNKGHRRNPGDVPRLSAWVAQYKELRGDVEPTTMAMIDQVGRLLLRYFTNDPTLDKISRRDAALWRVALSKGELRGANVFPKPDDQVKPATRHQKYRKAMKDRAPKPLSEGTVCKLVRCAKRLFEEAADDTGLGLIDRNPFKRLSGKAPPPPKSWAQVTAKDLERIRDACPNEGWRLAFTLCRLAGLRRGEALRLRWQDVQWDKNRLIVNATIAKPTTKKRRRVIPIEPARCPTGLAATLEKALGEALEGATLVCDGVSLGNIDKEAKRIIGASGLPIYSKPFHTLRKNREGELAREYPQHVLKEWMGHDPQVADEHYLRVDEDLYAAPAQNQKAQENPPVA